MVTTLPPQAKKLFRIVAVPFEKIVTSFESA